MQWRLIKTIIVLPANVLVFIPAAILWTAKDTKNSAELATAEQLFFWLALVAGSIGCIGKWGQTTVNA